MLLGIKLKNESCMCEIQKVFHDVESLMWNREGFILNIDERTVD
jgi:hypothetical protein